METGTHLIELEQIRDLAELLSEMIRQFLKTKEELMCTTLQVQIELLTNRMKRLKVSIVEIKSQLDSICVPKEAKIVEKEVGTKVRPYKGAEVEIDGTIEEFSWKTTHTLDTEKKALLQCVSEVLSDKVEKVYALYTKISMSLCETEKSHVR